MAFISHLCKISLHVKVAEEHDKGDHIQDEHVMHPQRKLAAGADAVDAQDESASELDLEDQKVLNANNLFHNN